MSAVVTRTLPSSATILTRPWPRIPTEGSVVVRRGPPVMQPVASASTGKIILPVLALATGCMTGGPRLTTTLPSVGILGHGRVRIVADDGSVRVTTADIAQVQMRVESRGYDVEKDLDMSMTPRGNEVDIVVKTRSHFAVFDFASRSLHIDVVIPRDTEVQVDSGDGSVAVEQIAGNLDIRTGDGSVAVLGAR